MKRPRTDLYPRELLSRAAEQLRRAGSNVRSAYAETSEGKGRNEWLRGRQGDAIFNDLKSVSEQIDVLQRTVLELQNRIPDLDSALRQSWSLLA